jgi:hypothetical protein
MIGSVDTIRKHPWVALQEKRVEPPEKPVVRSDKEILRNLIRPAKRSKYAEYQKCSWFSFNYGFNSILEERTSVE